MKSSWIGMWVRYHDRQGKMVIAPVEYFKPDGPGDFDVLHTTLNAISTNEVLEKRIADDFDIEAERRKVSAEVASRLIKLLEDYKSDLAAMDHSRKFRSPDDVLIPLIAQVNMEYLRGETE